MEIKVKKKGTQDLKYVNSMEKSLGDRMADVLELRTYYQTMREWKWNFGNAIAFGWFSESKGP